MADFVSLTDEDRERLMFLIDASLRVCKRFQFFLWAQGSLQSFIPHETLVCATGDLNALQLRSEVFSRASLPDEFSVLAEDPVRGFVAPIVSRWNANGRAPIVVEPGHGGENGLHPMLFQLQYHHNLCHGVREVRGSRGAFFLFLGLKRPVGERERYFAELLMPHLYMATLRMLEGEAVTGNGLVTVLSAREVQVLDWVRSGKTNAEIGLILEISPLTVKNHVQKILRKLEVSNRAQAVAKATSIGLFEKRDEPVIESR